MKKAKRSAAATHVKRAAPGTSGNRKGPDMAEIRQEITDLVASGALGMVAATIEEAGKGHHLGMKYLFELVGLYPATVADEELVSDSLAATLLHHLGLPEVPPPEQKVTKDWIAPSAIPEDSLE